MIHSLVPILFSFLFLVVYGTGQVALDSVRRFSPTNDQRQIEIRDSISQFRFNAPGNFLPSLPIELKNNPVPTVKDLTLSPLVLVVTVDGQVHALKRETGQWVWTLHDDGGAAVGGIDSQEKIKRARAGEAVGGALVKGAGRRQTSSRRGPLQLDEIAVEEAEEREEEIYIIEPKEDGDIYLYTRSSNGISSTLQKLPLSMTQLVSLSPFTFPTDSSKMFIGRKETKLVGIDLKSGRLVGVFGSEDGWCDWDEKKEGRVRTEEECEEEIQRRPEDLLYIARTEYHLLIYSKSPYSLLQTLTYTTYSSSNLGTALESEWTHTPDSRYLQPMHDGSLVCFLAGVSGVQWTLTFDTPVVSIFDIASSPNQNDREKSQPIMFKQPSPLAVEGLPIAFNKLSDLPEITFIGKIQSDFFAMSRMNYPLIAFAPINEIEQFSMAKETDENLETLPVCVGSDCLVGSHRLEQSHLVSELIEPPPKRLGIEAPPLSSSPTLNPSLISSLTPNKSSRPTVPAPDRSSVLANIFYRPAKKLSNDGGRSVGIGLLCLGLVSWIYGKKYGSKTNGRVGFSTLKSDLSILETDSDLRPLKGSLPPPTLLPAFTESMPLPLSSPILRDISKDLPPLPLTESVSGVVVLEEAEIESDGESKDDVEDTPKRKSRRRRGKKTKKGKVETVLFAEDGDVELANIQLADVEVIELDGDAVSGSSILIGGLSVSETLLGYGSHGTVVLKGEFQGRAVAVKRLLKDFVTIATHEVALLQESDDHPNVIRYFCKEQRDTFLYIALELCPASLYEIIDQPNLYPDLSKGLDCKKALKQITGGIRHLHKLKIVHRDIKPQNILVSPNKHGGIRMLISDFGLCKKLDLDESSFQQTVNHAAGSFGYRAPEVLRGQVDPNGASTPSNSTLGSRTGSVGSDTNTDPSMRLTRSIDIFSLGCIFYYVLTGGEHPFGGRYEREMNILKGKVTLESLDGLGEEALEVQDAITRMVATDPRERPTAEAVLLHPFFWNAQKRLLFICDASDRFEIMEREPPTPSLVALESNSIGVVGDDWSKSIDRSLLENLGKYRKYDGKSVRDLLRVLRNKKHHYQDLPENVRRNLGDLPGGFLSYFTLRFPRLLLHVYDVVAENLSEEGMFLSSFTLEEEEQ